jgi:MFS family permease
MQIALLQCGQWDDAGDGPPELASSQQVLSNSDFAAPLGRRIAIATGCLLFAARCHMTDVLAKPRMTDSSLPTIEGGSNSQSIYNRTFWLAYLANTALVLGNALTFRFAELVNYLGGSERVTGDIVALALAVSILVRLSVSHVIDDYGTRRMWILTAILFISGSLLFMNCREISWLLYLARIAYFVGLTGMFACSMTHIQNQVPPHRRTEVIGNLGSSGFVGLILGSNIGDWIVRSVPPGRLQFQLLFGLATVVGFVYLIIVVVMTHGQQWPHRRSAAPAFRQLFHHWPGMVVLAAMVMGLGVVVTTVFLTRFATGRGIEGIGVFFTGYAISAFCFRLLAASWSRTIGRHWMLVRGLAGHAIGHLMLAYATSGWHFIIPSIICGFGHSLLFPAIVSLGAGAFPKEARGSGTAIILAFVDFGQFIFAPILGRIIVHYDFPTMFLVSSAIGLAMCLAYVVIALRYHDQEVGPVPASLSGEMD